MAPFPGMTGHLPVGSVMISGYFHHGKGKHFVLTEINTLGMSLPFLPAMLLPEPPSGDLQSALCVVMVFRTTMSKKFTPEQGSKTVGSCSWHSLVSLCSQRSWNSCLGRMVAGFLKIQLQRRLGGYTLQSWDKVLHKKLHMLLVSIQYMVLFLSQPGFVGPGTKGVII